MFYDYKDYLIGKWLNLNENRKWIDFIKWGSRVGFLCVVIRIFLCYLLFIYFIFYCFKYEN